LRLIAFDQFGEALQMLHIQRPFSTDGQADTVQRQRILLADQTEKMMKRAAGDHVVFGVDFEETDVRLCTQHFTKVPGLEPQPGTRRSPARAA
jgi:hypothetical protein